MGQGEAMGALSEVHGELDRLCAVSVPGGSGSVAVWGHKGGAAKTTTAAGIMHELSERLVGMLVGVDANPERGNLTQRLGLSESHVPGRLFTLAQDPAVVRYLADWAGYLDRVGRIHLLHNDSVPVRAVSTLTEAQYTAVFDLLARYAEIQVVDLGLSALHPASRATLRRVDHLVVTVPADSSVLRLATEALDELAYEGHGNLLSRATVVITQTQRFHPRVYRELVDFLTGRVGHVQLVPYDRAAGPGVSAVRWNRLGNTTKLAYAQITRHVLKSLHQAARGYEDIPSTAFPESTAAAAGQHHHGRQVWMSRPTDCGQPTNPQPAEPIAPASLPSWATRAAESPR